jgi:hypothetical protein
MSAAIHRREGSFSLAMLAGREARGPDLHCAAPAVLLLLLLLPKPAGLLAHLEEN